MSALHNGLHRCSKRGHAAWLHGRSGAILRGWLVLWWLIVVGVSPALAQLYRWTDDTGKVHITDNPETIPPAYRERARSSPAATPASDTKADAPSVAPSPTPRPRAPAPAPSQDISAPTTPQIQELQQRIAAARQELQTYLTQLRNERTVHTMPTFVRRRRQIADVARALLAVEQRLDTLYSQLEEARKQAQAAQAPPTAQDDSGFDDEGHDATYWQQRLTTARERLRQAHGQRQALLTQLTAAAGDSEGAAERQGRAILQQADALYQIEQEIDAAEAALQTLPQEARRAGAPLAWLQ